MSSSFRKRDRSDLDINLSSVRYDSTCISLNLPLHLCCMICHPKKDPMTKSRKRSSEKSFRKTADRYLM